MGGYFSDKGFKFQPAVCNMCHDVLKMSMNVNDIAILNVHGVNYHCIINGIIKCETINLLKNVDINQKCGSYKIQKHSLQCIKR